MVDVVVFPPVGDAATVRVVEVEVVLLVLLLGVLWMFMAAGVGAVVFIAATSCCCCTALSTSVPGNSFDSLMLLLASVDAVLGDVPTAIGDANFTVGAMLSVCGLLPREEGVLRRSQMGSGAEHGLPLPPPPPTLIGTVVAGVVPMGAGAPQLMLQPVTAAPPAADAGRVVCADFAAVAAVLLLLLGGGTPLPTTATPADTADALEEERLVTMPAFTPQLLLKSPK
jgi:hypothetical protein